MKHVVLSGAWEFGTDPFAAYRSSMSYGRNQNDREFIGVSGITPNADGILQENAFKVIKTKAGEILIVAGGDVTPRCLLFVGSSGGFRGGVELFAEATTGRVLKTCSASNAIESGIEIAAILDVGQSIAFYAYGRRTNQVEVHTWNGNEIESKTWPKRAWDRRNDPERSDGNVTWMPGNFRIVQLSGNDVEDGITFENGRLSRSADGDGRLAHGFNVPTDSSLELQSVRFGRDMHNELVIAPADGDVDSDRYAVLVHEYSPGSGAKRWPSFSIGWDNAGSVEKLSSVYRSKGSGSDSYTLVIAPVGWAENIAGQFVNVKDYGGQTIAYNPGNTGKKASDVPADLLIAFRGNEEVTRQFMGKVAGLNPLQLDTHVLFQCGRAAVRSHLEEVSGDPEFFLGSDPRVVVGYVRETHFPDGETDEHPKPVARKLGSGGQSSSMGNALADALRNAGLK